MSGATDPDPADPGHEELIRRFERDWLAGGRPSLDEYLAQADPPAHTLLVELAHADLEFRIKAGQPARAGDYLARYPQLAADPSSAAGLIATEYELCSRTDPGLAFDAVAVAYPQYRDRLEELRGRFTPPPLGGGGPHPPAPVRPAAPGYDILGRLGRGGMGV
ncbi:MAG: hypothetical protein K2X87_16470, partial [Gemmataceae bacterium]|nr:hypothetical protein [Gemmataceae bacterium]